MPPRMDPPVNGPYAPFHNYDGYDWGPIPCPPDRLNQGPFGVEQDEGWHTLMLTTPARAQVRNFGMGLVGYAWEERGAPPVPGATLEQTVDDLARLPFCDKLYIRCDWKEVQTRPGRLDLNPVWPLAISLAKELGLGIGFRIQMSTPNFFPELAMPKFLAERSRFVELGDTPHGKTDMKWREPDYTDPVFQKAFRELNELLAAEFDGDPLFEWMDLMQYGFWGEGHTHNMPASAIAPYATIMETFLDMTRLQYATWRHTPVAVNTQPDISRAGNDAVHDLAIRLGGWLRTDSILTIEESQQIEMISNRPPTAGLIVEDGAQREYQPDDVTKDIDSGVPNREAAALHSLDVGANYWALWQMGRNLGAYHERFPRAFDTLEERIGWRVRPSWVLRRKRYGRIELIVVLKNDGVASMPGTLRVYLESKDGKVKMGGALDPGHPYAGKLRHASFLLPEGVDYEGLTLRAEIETKGLRRPVKWACEQETNADGTLSLVLSKYANTRWRKDV